MYERSVGRDAYAHARVFSFKKTSRNARSGRAILIVWTERLAQPQRWSIIAYRWLNSVGALSLI